MLLVYHAGTAHNLSGPELLHLNSVIKALVSMFWLHSIIVVFLKSDGWVHYLLFLLTIGWTLFRPVKQGLGYEEKIKIWTVHRSLQLQRLLAICSDSITLFMVWQGRSGKRAYVNAAYIPEENGGLNRQLETRNGWAEAAAAPSSHTAIAIADDEKLPGKDQKEEEEEDPWALPELKNTDTPWKSGVIHVLLGL